MENFVNKLVKLDKSVKVASVHQQVLEVEEIIAKINKKKVLTTRPSKLEIMPDKFEELSTELSESQIEELRVLNKLLNNFRIYLSRRYGIWSVPNLTTTSRLKQEFNVKSALEIMAGNGYWSLALNEVGVKTVATDSLQWAKTSQTGSNSFYPVEKLSAQQAIEKYSNVDLILCSWAPNFGTEDYAILQTYRKYCDSRTKLFFIGEKNGATNTNLFWQAAKIVDRKKIKRVNQTFQSFDFIDEKFYGIG